MQQPKPERIAEILALYHQGDLVSVAEHADALAPNFPGSLVLWQLLGVANLGLGRPDQAAQAFGRARDIAPDHPDSYSNLGAALKTQGKLDEAIAAYRRAIAIKPDHADAHTNLGAALQAQGRLEDAIAAHRRAIAIKPDHADAYANLGAGLQAQGRLEEAIAAYQQAIAIRPHFADAHRHLGVALKTQGRPQEAEASFRQAIAIRPGHAEAHTNLGSLLEAIGRPEEAEAAHRRAIAIRPDHADAHTNLGVALRAQGKPDEAIAAYQRAIAIKPDHAIAQYNLGNILKMQGRAEEAIAAYRRALAIKPDYADAHTNLGVALKEQDKLEEAVAAYRQAIALKPDHADAQTNLGVVLAALGELDEAIAAHRRALAIKPDHADAHYNLALVLLRAGQFSTGWAEHEWRWRRQRSPQPRPSGKPLWRGEPLPKGSTILLWGEQGLGDQIQFARYASCVSDLGARVILEVNGALVPLLSGLRGVSEVIAGGTPDSEFDVHCSLMSLPFALGTELSTIPPVPLITAHRAEVPRWAERLGSDLPKIGIAWSGSQAYQNDRSRSMPLSAFRSVMSEEFRWVVLQKDIRDADRPYLDSLSNVVCPGENFVNTAAIAESCDLVISVDTSIAHLAATIGRPVWLLQSFDADWRWLQGRADSPWYPTVKLYPQQRMGDWDRLLRRVSADLRARRSTP